MPRMIITRLPYTDYYLTNRMAKYFEWEWQKGVKTVLVNYTKLNLALYKGKVPTTVVGNMRLN